MVLLGPLMVLLGLGRLTHPLMLCVFDSLAVREFLCLDEPPGPFDSLEESRVSPHASLSAAPQAAEVGGKRLLLGTSTGSSLSGAAVTRCYVVIRLQRDRNTKQATLCPPVWWTQSFVRLLEVLMPEVSKMGHEKLGPSQSGKISDGAE